MLKTLVVRTFRIRKTSLRCIGTTENQKEMSQTHRNSVYVTRNIPNEALEMLREKCDVKQWTSDEPVPREVLLQEVHSVDGLFCLLTDKIDSELLDYAANLKVIGTMSVGYEHIDVAECRKRQIGLGYTPNVLTEATAELAVALLLTTSRRLFEANKAVFNGTWGAWKPMWMCGQGVNGATVGIVGFGRIGLSVAKKLLPFAPKEVVYHNRSKNVEAEKLGARLVSFDEILRTSDFLLITCQLNEQTKNMMNAEAFSKMKSNAVLINISRGGVIEQDALYDALKAKKIASAGLDVCYPEPLPPTHKLLTLDNLVLLPHIGSATVESRTRMATLTAENILAGLAEIPLTCTIP